MTFHIPDRSDYILRYCQGKTVLDLGSIGASFHHERWLFPKIKSVAKHTRGIDYNREAIPEANRIAGSGIEFGNVLELDLKEKFDVIVAGELIEHLTDVGVFLENIKKHLQDDGVFIVTTPNVFALSSIARALLVGSVPHHPDHVLFYDIGTLRYALKRHGFRVIRHYYTTEREETVIRSTIIRLLGKWRPLWNTDLMVVCQMESSLRS